LTEAVRFNTTILKLKLCRPCEQEFEIGARQGEASYVGFVKLQMKLCRSATLRRRATKQSKLADRRVAGSEVAQP
jgi:hypothetical protein